MYLKVYTIKVQKVTDYSSSWFVHTAWVRKQSTERKKSTGVLNLEKEIKTNIARGEFASCDWDPCSLNYNDIALYGEDEKSERGRRGRCCPQLRANQSQLVLFLLIVFNQGKVSAFSSTRLASSFFSIAFMSLQSKCTCTLLSGVVRRKLPRFVISWFWVKIKQFSKKKHHGVKNHFGSS